MFSRRNYYSWSKSLEENGFRGAIIKAVIETINKSKEMSKKDKIVLYKGMDKKKRSVKEFFFNPFLIYQKNIDNFWNS